MGTLCCLEHRQKPFYQQRVHSMGVPLLYPTVRVQVQKPSMDSWGVGFMHPMTLKNRVYVSVLNKEKTENCQEQNFYHHVDCNLKLSLGLSWTCHASLESTQSDSIIFKSWLRQRRTHRLEYGKSHKTNRMWVPFCYLTLLFFIEKTQIPINLTSWPEIVKWIGKQVTC